MLFFLQDNEYKTPDKTDKRMMNKSPKSRKKTNSETHSSTFPDKHTNEKKAENKDRC